MLFHLIPHAFATPLAGYAVASLIAELTTVDCTPETMSQPLSLDQLASLLADPTALATLQQLVDARSAKVPIGMFSVYSALRICGWSSLLTQYS
jgi:hypothetical protein